MWLTIEIEVEAVNSIENIISDKDYLENRI